MGFLARIAIIMKSCIGTASEKIERVAAEEELRLARVRKEAIEELGRSDMQVGAALAPISKLAADYRLLGLNSSADLGTVETAWRRLAERADPKRFPTGSDEEKRAADILRSVNAAYARIREALDPTEGRFGRLEL